MGRYMLIMFACDIGLAPSQANTELGVRSGILGIIDGMAGMTQGDFNEDYAERVVEKVATAIHVIHEFTFAPQRFESFYTPLFNLLMIIPAVIWMLKTIATDFRDPDQSS